MIRTASVRSCRHALSSKSSADVGSDVDSNVANRNRKIPVLASISLSYGDRVHCFQL